MVTRLVFACLIGTLWALPLVAQRDSLPQFGVDQEQLLEQFGDASDGNEVDLTAVLTSTQSQIDLNKADEEQLNRLVDMCILNGVQIADFLRHRNATGLLISLLELQSIPSFDLPTIERLLPFVTLDANAPPIPLKKMLVAGNNDLFMRWGRVLQEQRGYTKSTSENTQYQGTPDKLYMRYKHGFEQRLSYGFTAEKDQGEPFFTPKNRQGFDFYSAHFFLRDYTKLFKTVALGDYAISFGQGLIALTGLTYNKSSLVMNIKKTNPVLRPYRSVYEAGFLRGAAVTLNLGNKIEWTSFASQRKRDGNIRVTIDSSEIISDNDIGFSSFINAGLHRTTGELADKNTVQQSSVGSSLKYKTQSGHIALNGIYDQFDQPLRRNLRPYNQFAFNNSDRSYNASLDYSFILQNFNLFGETAIDKDGTVATLHGLLVSLDQRIGLSMLFRHYPKDYVALNANAFGESNGTQNESGLYMGLNFRPNRNWELNSYFDTYQHPWLRSRADAPSKGYDWRTRLTYTKRRNIEAYIQVRYEEKEQNLPKNNTPLDILVPLQSFQTRLSVRKVVNPSLAIKTQLDVGFNRFKDHPNTKTEGISFFQDIIYRPLEVPIQVVGRFAIFDTDSFATRFYNYENNLLYTFSIPAYYGRGTRFYLNLRYKGIPRLMIEARYERTYRKDVDQLGSGSNTINGKVVSALSAQLRYRF